MGVESKVSASLTSVSNLSFFYIFFQSFYLSLSLRKDRKRNSFCQFFFGWSRDGSVHQPTYKVQPRAQKRIRQHLHAHSLVGHFVGEPPEDFQPKSEPSFKARAQM